MIIGYLSLALYLISILFVTIGLQNMQPKEAYMDCHLNQKGINLYIQSHALEKQMSPGDPIDIKA